ncbi:ATP-dependent DNA helicase PIF1-like protein [Tanacetum coccineum]
MTVNNRLCATLKETCFAYGLLNDNKEWSLAISEASLWALAPQLRDTFVTMLLFCDLIDEQIRNYCLLEIQELLNRYGIASLLLPGSRTAHSRCVIPLDLMENSTCGIKQNTQLAELMQEVRMIIWDEAPMTQIYAFEALDITLRDILGYKNPKKRDWIFRGMTILLVGDFRQILPVIPKAKRPEIVQACINRSEL